VLPLYDDHPTGRSPIVSYGLISVCVLVFLWQESLGPRTAEEVVLAFGMVPAVLFGHAALPPRLELVPAWSTLLTSTFLHGGWLHLLGNMLYLWLFGRGVETALGSWRFFLFYPFCGAAAALVQAAMDPDATVPMIGASGAIAGTLGGYLVLYPRGNVVVLIWVLFFVRLVTVPAVIMLGLWFLLQLTSAVSAPPGEPGVAFWAHVAGFVVGTMAVAAFRHPRVSRSNPPRILNRRGGGSVPSAGRPRHRVPDRWG